MDNKYAPLNFKLFLFLFCLLGCHSSNNIKDIIKGNWYFENISDDVYIKITNDEYTVENDSPYSEDYKIIGDTMFIKGFEAEFRESAGEPGYTDTLKIVMITKNKMILKDKIDTLMLYKK